MKSLVLDFIQVIVMSFAIFIVFYIGVFQPNQVRGESMLPTFENNEYLLTDKVTYRWVREPEQGDVVVFKSPENNNLDFIKRIIAVPGDEVRVEGGSVFVNSQLLNEPYLMPGLQTRGGIFLKEGRSFTVPEGGYIVFGDNRNASSDSREWGPVPEENIIGKAWFRYWPPKKIGVLEGM